MDTEQTLEATRSYWDNEASTFDNEADHGLRDPAVRQAWTALLAELLPPPAAPILDIGCGTGSLSLVLATLGYQVVGVDLSEAMIRHAKEKAASAGYAISFQVMDACSVEFRPQQFSGIVCRHLLWALPDVGAALRRWSTFLVPGGRLLLIEGFWHTGAGLKSQEVVAALPDSCVPAEIRNLSDQADLWGNPVTDTRYVVVVDCKADGC